MVLPSPKWERPKYWRETHLATSLVTRIERSSHRTILYRGEIVFTFFMLIYLQSFIECFIHYIHVGCC